jgi:Fe-S-cluster containining protein
MKSASEMRFQCQPGCTRCCDQQGFVYLADTDVPRLADYLGMPVEDFERKYVYRTKNRARLRTPRHAQCVFLKDGGCGVHPAKPTQCRTFPFWPELVESAQEWRRTAGWCPGIGQGELVNIESAREQAGEMRRAYPASY